MHREIQLLNKMVNTYKSALENNIEESNNHIKSLDKTIEAYKLKLENSDKETNLRTAALKRKLKLRIQFNC